MELYCKKCNCAFDINDVQEYVSGYGEIINICPECRNPLGMLDENYLYGDDEWDEEGDF